MARVLTDADSLPVADGPDASARGPHPAGALGSSSPEPRELRRRISWVNTLFLATAHLLALGGVVYLVTVRCSPATLALAAVWFWFCGFSITGGYHRLFAHRSYRAALPVRLFHLFFGAASVQNSALSWASDHRRHHAREGSELDPYDIDRGFFWAHIGWVFYEEPDLEPSGVDDLEKDPWVRFQHRAYPLLALLFGALLPMGIAALWGDAWGGLLVAGFLRLVAQWHSTFAVNSFAHCVGSRPYSETTTARDSFLVAIVSLGEGYHNFHHRFPADYRNGLRALTFDPTKWTIWSLAKVGLTSDLKRTPPERIERAKRLVLESKRPGVSGVTGVTGAAGPAGTSEDEVDSDGRSSLAVDRQAAG